MSYNTPVCNPATSVSPDELRAFQDAIKNTDTRKEIISILEEAGSLRELHRQPA